MDGFPQPHQNHEPAQALVRLSGCLHRRLTLVVAPAGCGKSKLIRTWRDQADVPAALISLTGQDNRPERFFDQLIQALKHIDMQLPVEKLSEDIGDSSFDLEQGVIELINRVADYSQDLVLVFDNYHVIQQQAIHNSLEWMLEYLPPNLHIIIASRSEPPLQVPRLRVRRQLLELGPQVLCPNR